MLPPTKADCLASSLLTGAGGPPPTKTDRPKKHPNFGPETFGTEGRYGPCFSYLTY